MNEDEDEEGAAWSALPEPADDERVLWARPGTVPAGHGPPDYVAAIVTQDASWWAALSDYEHAYGLLRAMESACARGAPLHLARCVHHLHDLLAGLDPPDRAWVGTLLQRLQDRLVPRAEPAGSAGTLTGLLAALSTIGADPRFAPPPMVPLGLLPRLYPQGMRLEELREALDPQRYPRGQPLPACPLCEPVQAEPADALAQAVTALLPAQRTVLVHLGQALALDGDAPALAEQLAWVTAARPVPATYQALLAQAQIPSGDADPLTPALDAPTSP